jgi:hypothetical protein
VVTALATAGASIHWLARPHLFTLFFTVVFLGILDEAYVGAVVDHAGTGEIPAASKKKLYWLLPALTVLWTNLHGGFLAGLIVIAAYIGGGLMGALLEPDTAARQAILARVRPFFISGMLCALASVVNPYFIGLHEHIVKYLMDPYQYEHIIEFMAFNFGHPASRYIEPLMLLAAATACWNLYRRRFEYFVLLAGWLHMALRVRRNMPLFLLICAPFVAEAIFCWLRGLESAHTAGWLKSAVRRFEESARNIGITDRLPRLHLVSAAALVVLATLLYAPQPPQSFQASQDPKGFPVQAANMLMRDGDTRIFTTDTWGGYVIYRLYPKAQVFIDGRSDFYGQDLELKYLDVLSAKYDWDKNLDHYGAKTVLVPADAALASALKTNPRWRVVYDDKMALIFRLVNQDHPSQQVSKCPNPGTGESCGGPASGAATMAAQTLLGASHPRNNFVAEISPPRLPLLNRP